MPKAERQTDTLRMLETAKERGQHLVVFFYVLDISSEKMSLWGDMEAIVPMPDAKPYTKALNRRRVDRQKEQKGEYETLVAKRAAEKKQKVAAVRASQGCRRINTNTSMIPATHMVLQHEDEGLWRR
ncbi:hypothetical protein BU17DRAFT_69187 [Hysterangium stoloniferum]|nr:hypothetical protein BU17DRAFT_69187 [Hysterangium stoloniferum]